MSLIQVATLTMKFSLMAQHGGVVWMATLSTSPMTGVVTQLSGRSGDVVIKSEYLNPIEIISGHWIFMVHRRSMTL